MPYKKSIARLEFEEVVQEFKGQIKYACLKKNGLRNDIQQCVLRNSIFQTSAALEVFIKDLFSDWVHLLTQKNKTVKDIPESLLFWTLAKTQKDAFGAYTYQKDEEKLIKQLSCNNRLGKLRESNTYIRDIMNITENVSDKKYPSQKNINHVFMRFGIDNIFHAMHVKGRKDYKKLLESFSDVRTAIAHEHPTPTLVYRDIKSHLDSMLAFVAMLDRIMWSHVVNHSGSDCWKISRL